MAAIYKRELKSYFYSMTGCIFIAFMTLFLGIYFMSYNLGSGYPYFSFSLTGMLSIMMFSIPVLTMRSLSDERRSRTDQLLLTSPVSVTGIVLGKYLSMITVFAATVLVAALCPLIIMANGTAYLAADYASLLAYFLLGCVFISIGLFLSSLTESQIIAAVSTFGVLFHVGAEVAEDDANLWAQVALHYTQLTADSFMIFNLLCAPCFAAMGAIKREMNNAKWTWFAIGYQCGFAYLCALMVNQFGKAFTGSLNVIGLVAAIAALAFIIYMLVRPYKEATKLSTKV